MLIKIRLKNSLLQDLKISRLKHVFFTVHSVYIWEVLHHFLHISAYFDLYLCLLFSFTFGWNAFSCYFCFIMIKPFYLSLYYLLNCTYYFFLLLTYMPLVPSVTTPSTPLFFISSLSWFSVEGWVMHHCSCLSCGVWVTESVWSTLQASNHCSVEPHHPIMTVMVLHSYF